jgi:SAM-dependent methyltransferase
MKTRHALEIEETRQLWKDKPLLAQIYRDFHLQIAEKLSLQPGLIVELGSGLGQIKAVIPHCLTTDLQKNLFIDQVENSYSLSFAEQSVASLILFDVWHHLEYPGDAVQEFQRVLIPGGRVIIFDPDMSLLGKIIYGPCHHEPLGLNHPFVLHAPDKKTLASPPYFAAQSSAHRHFVKKTIPSWSALHWNLLSTQRISSLSYAASGGFRGPQLYPTCLYSLIKKIDAFLELFPELFSTRLLTVLELKNI